MPEFNIGIILVIVASLSTFLFATKELLMNPPQTHHFRRQLSIDPKTVTYKSHSQSNNYPITNTKQQVTLVHSESQPKNMPQYSTTTTQQTTGENRMASGPFPSEIEHGTLQHSQALLQQQSGTQSDGYNRNEQGTQTMNTNYETTAGESLGYNGQRTVDSSQIGREWNSGNSAVSATNNRLTSNGMSSGDHLLEEERSSSMASSDTDATTGGLRSSGGLWSSEGSSTTDAATKSSNKSPSSPTGGLRFHGTTVSGNSNPVVLSDSLWSSNGASHSDTSIVSDSSLGSSGTSFNAAIQSRERIPSKQTFSTSSMPKDSSGVVWSFNEGKSIGVSSSSSGGKDFGGSGISTNGVPMLEEQRSGSLFSSSSGFNSGGFSSSSSRETSGGLRSSFNSRSGGLQVSSGSKNVVEQMEDNMIPHKSSNGMLQRDSQGQKSRRKLEFVHITKTGGTAIETAAADQANVMWGACHYRSIKYQKCDSPDWPKVQRRVEERMPAGLKYVGEPWHCPTQWQLPYMFDDVDTFVVVRNPYERVVSEYYCSSYGYKGPKPDLVETFNQWVFGNVTEVTRALHGHMLPQAYYVYDENDNKIIDHVIRYENLSAEFDALMVEYGLPITLPSKKEGIPMFHTYNRKGVSHNQHMTVNDLSPENIAKINEVYVRDFELFGYRIL